MLPVFKSRKSQTRPLSASCAVIDLRRYGLSHAAPRVDGQRILVFTQDASGVLRPAA